MKLSTAGLAAIVTLVTLSPPAGSTQTEAAQPAEEARSQATAVKLNMFVITLIDDVPVPAREAGVLVSLDAKDSQVVKKGDPLGRIDDSDAQIRLLIAENEMRAAEAQADSDADLKAAQATIGVAKAEYDKSREIKERVPNAVSEFEMARLKLTHEQSVYRSANAEVQHRVDQLTKEMRIAQIQAVKNEIARRHVESPIDGVVVKRYRSPGEWVQVGEPVYRVVRMDRLRVEGMLKASEFMPEEIVDRPVMIEVPTPRGVEKIQSKIAFVNNVVDSSGEFLVYAEFDNPRKPNGRWLVRPGLEATVTILLEADASARRTGDRRP